MNHLLKILGITDKEIVEHAKISMCSLRNNSNAAIETKRKFISAARSDPERMHNVRMAYRELKEFLAGYNNIELSAPYDM